jgi:biopolymer transport protein TolR
VPRKRNRNGGLPSHAEINVVSLVDVAFTLLVIFIITAPIMQGGVDVTVPRAQADPIASPEGVIVSITRAGEIYIGESAVAWEAFEDALVDVVQRERSQRVYLRADDGVAYGEVLRVLGAMQATDVAAVGLFAEPEPRARGR